MVVQPTCIPVPIFIPSFCSTFLCVLFQPVYTLFIVNKAGSLIYHKNLSTKARTINANECLYMASVFHGLFLNASSLSPLKSVNLAVPQGIEAIVTENFRLECLRTLTGVKFFITADPDADYLKALLSDLYMIYSDYVLKDPFYVVEMPIRLQKFDQKVSSFIIETAARGEMKSPSSRQASSRRRP